MQTSHDPHAACEAKIFALRAENDDLRRQLDAANSVIRRQVDWEYLPAVAALPAVWTPRDPFGRVDGSDDPVTPAEDAAIRAALDVPAADPASGPCATCGGTQWVPDDGGFPCPDCAADPASGDTP